MVDYKFFSLRFNSLTDADVIKVLSEQDNITGYIRSLIRRDTISNFNGYKSLEERARIEKLKYDFICWAIDENLDSELLVEYFGFDTVFNDFINNNGKITLSLEDNPLFMKELEDNMDKNSIDDTLTTNEEK